MNKEKKLSVLIEKFINNEISAEELELLSSYLNQNDINTEIEPYSREKWHSNKSIKNFEPKQTWNKIKGRIAEDESIKISLKSPKRNILYSFSKYAAIFLTILTASWLTYRLYTDMNDLTGDVYNEYSVPYGSKSSLILPDGSKILLNSGSKIKYSDDFIKKERIVFLEGEAFFDVKSVKKMPFTVKTSDLNIKVFGTKFNVKSFKEEGNVQTTLVSGSIAVEKVDKNGNIVQNIKLKPNQIFTYLKSDDKFLLRTSEKPKSEEIVKTNNTSPDPEISIEPVISQSIELATSWTDNKLTFRADSINELISKLQRWYDVEITLKNNHLNKSTFTGTFDNETIEQALKALKLTTNFSYTIDKNKIKIY